MNCDYKVLIRIVDEFLESLVHSSLISGVEVRDMLLDLRSSCMQLDLEANPEEILV